MDNIFINIDKQHYKELIGISSSNPDFYKVAFINDGSGIITRGKLYVNSSYWIKFVNIDELPPAALQEENTIYMVVEES